MRKAKFNNEPLKNQDKPKRKPTKIVLLSVILIVVVVLAVFAVNYVKNKNKIYTFSVTYTGGIKNEDTGDLYTLNAGSISARDLGKQYGVVSDGKLFKINSIKGEEISPKDYLVDEEGNVFRGLNIGEITLEQFNAIGAYFYYQGSATGGRLIPENKYLADEDKLPDDVPNDSLLTKKIIDVVLNGESVIPDEPDGNDVYELKFCSADYPAFYYSLFCLRDKNNKVYIYCFDNGQYYDCPSELAARLWQS